MINDFADFVFLEDIRALEGSTSFIARINASIGTSSWRGLKSLTFYKEIIYAICKCE